MIVLDTTILTYDSGRAHPLRDPCQRLFHAITDGHVRATTTVEVIQEFAHVRSRIVPRPDAVRMALDYADVLSPLLATDDQTLRSGLRLFERHALLGSFDAVLAAVAIANGAEALVSADSGFSDVARLKHVAPGTHAFDELLGR